MIFWTANPGFNYLHACSSPFNNGETDNWEGKIIYMEKKAEKNNQVLKIGQKSIENNIVEIEKKLNKGVEALEKKLSSNICSVEKSLNEKMNSLDKKIERILSLVNKSD